VSTAPDPHPGRRPVRFVGAVQNRPQVLFPADRSPHHEKEVHIMALPQLSPEQRDAALAKAGEARKVRADFKDRLKSGQLTADAALSEALGDPVLQKMKAKAFLESVPKVGKVKAAAALEEIGIADNRRLRGLGEAQLRKVREFVASVAPAAA
jgi:hypothetical protein